MSKLQKLIQSWPIGTVALQSWVNEMGVYKQLSKKYIDGGWIQKIGHGAFIRKEDHINWMGGLYAIQKELGLPIHVGGKTALELLENVHYVPMQTGRVVYLYSHEYDPNLRLPKWFVQYFEQSEFFHVNKKIFSTAIGLQEFSCGQFSIEISCIERALLELLSLVPEKISFGHANLLSEGQDTLRVDILQPLLESCFSQLVKKLFLFLAKKNNLSFFSRLNLDKIKLDSRKTIIGEGDQYIPEFHLCVPMSNLDDFQKNNQIF